MTVTDLIEILQALPPDAPADWTLPDLHDGIPTLIRIQNQLAAIRMDAIAAMHCPDHHHHRHRHHLAASERRHHRTLRQPHPTPGVTSPRDGDTCIHQHCTVPVARTIAHHLIHWADRGPTDIWNLGLLCLHHHDQAHKGKLTIVIKPDGSYTAKPRT